MTHSRIWGHYRAVQGLITPLRASFVAVPESHHHKSLMALSLWGCFLMDFEVGVGEGVVVLVVGGVGLIRPLGGLIRPFEPYRTLKVLIRLSRAL